MPRIGWKLLKCLVCCGFMTVAVAAATHPARADEWGCEVLLCMSNPAGPEAVGQCVPPMQRFYHVLSHGGSRPTCSESGWSGGIGYEPLECPQGYDLTRSGLGVPAQCQSATGGIVPPERRTDPYFVDIPNTNGRPGDQRIWFSHP